MTKPVKILTDSTNDLLQEQLESNDVSVLPLYAVLGEKSLRDGVDVSVEELLAWSDENKTTPKTAAASVSDFVDFFTPFVDEGRSVVYVGLSSGISSTIQNAKLAAEEFPSGTVEIVDSLNLSSGVGYLVLEAARLSKEGKSASGIRSELEIMVPKVNVSFIIDTLVYLHRGGRCSTVAMLGANLLSLKPEIIVRNGKMTTNRKYRGSLAKSLERYVKDHLAEGEKIDPRRILITHSKMDPELVQPIVEMIRETGYFDEVTETFAGCVISSHCGPNCLGVIYMNR